MGKDIDDCLCRAEKFGDYRGRLTRSAATLLEALKERDNIWQKIEHAYVYAAMKKMRTTEWTNIRQWTTNAGASLPG